MIKTILLVLVASFTLAAQDVTINVKITVSKEVIDAVNTWRLRQTTGDPSVLVFASNLKLLEKIIENGILRILHQEPSVSIAVEKAKIAAAKTAIQTLKDNAVSIP